MILYIIVQKKFLDANFVLAMFFGIYWIGKVTTNFTITNNSLKGMQLDSNISGARIFYFH